LAGVNRPASDEEFETVNLGLTTRLLASLTAAGRKPHIVFASSIQAELDNPYGRSKRAAETAIAAFVDAGSGTATILRLRNIFGKWCRPDYNSVVATFCHRIARDQPIRVDD